MERRVERRQLALFDPTILARPPPSVSFFRRVAVRVHVRLRRIIRRVFERNNNINDEYFRTRYFGLVFISSCIGLVFISLCILGHGKYFPIILLLLRQNKVRQLSSAPR